MAGTGGATEGTGQESVSSISASRIIEVYIKY